MAKAKCENQARRSEGGDSSTNHQIGKLPAQDMTTRTATTMVAQATEVQASLPLLNWLLMFPQNGPGGRNSAAIYQSLNHNIDIHSHRHSHCHNPMQFKSKASLIIHSPYAICHMHHAHATLRPKELEFRFAHAHRLKPRCSCYSSTESLLSYSSY